MAREDFNDGKEMAASFELPVVDESAESNGSDAESDQSLDIAALRERLKRRIEENPETAYWRSFDDLADTPEFQDVVKHEFPAGADTMTDPVTRRGFMKVMGASLALAGLGACVRQPEEKIVPYIKQPEEIVPGKPLFFATALTIGGYARGVLVESHEGRPTKIDGNPDHPSTLGSSDPYMQAEILQMYDPDRSQEIRHKGEIKNWDRFTAALQQMLGASAVTGGSGLRILTETVTSPTLAAQISQLLQTYPNARWHQYESVASSGRTRVPMYDLTRASVIVCLDDDLLYGGPWSVRYARDFSTRRGLEDADDRPTRLYVAEPCPTVTGQSADHRLPARAIDIRGIAGAIAAGVGAGGSTSAPLSDKAKRWVAAIVDDLKKNSGVAVVTAGASQPQEVHDLVDAINAAISAPVTYVTSAEAVPTDQLASIRQLAEEMKGGTVETLIVVGGNPVYDAPADLDFGARYLKVANTVHFGLYDNETAFASKWHVPASHSLEMWSDARSYDGTTTIIQPLIAPLYQTKSVHQFLAALNGDTAAKDADLVRTAWEGRLGGEKGWRKALHDGFVPVAVSGAQPATTVPVTPRRTSDTTTATVDTAVAAVPAPVTGDTARPTVADTDTAAPQPSPTDAGGLEVNFRPDPCILDGRYVNNAWMQELPKPVSKLVWDNAVLISPATAQKYDVSNGEIVSLKNGDRGLNGVIWIVPGVAENSVTIYLGYGRTRTGRVGENTGFNASLIRTTDAFWFGTGFKLDATRQSYQLVTTQDHPTVEGRNLYRQITLSEFVANPAAIKEMEHLKDPPSFYGTADWKYDGYAWGMTIDLNKCIGCNACTIACQSENNISVVGKDQCANGREMHWIRIDRYFSNKAEDPSVPLDDPAIYTQPVTCMQCEQAPCEVVCPVAATVHSAEGLNDMVYNRCVGTRYCSNNCPYKVRRFNFLHYIDNGESMRLMRNPDVTVRARGVMEKCTYCVQRINHARIQAKIENRKIRDGEIVTACQQACPTEAIWFGDINDPAARVVKLKLSDRNYSMLAELNTRPRTSYLARIVNSHESLQQATVAYNNPKPHHGHGADAEQHGDHGSESKSVHE